MPLCKKQWAESDWLFLTKKESCSDLRGIGYAGCKEGDILGKKNKLRGPYDSISRWFVKNNKNKNKKPTNK